MYEKTTDSGLPEFQLANNQANHIKNNEEVVNGSSVKAVVQVGVGGLFLTNEKCAGITKECVLLYKRYKNPEIHQWSLLGGHVEVFNTCEDTLKKKINKIMRNQIQERDIEVLDIVTAVNHFNEDELYHYVSPQYYVNIKTTAFKKMPKTNKLHKNADDIVILDTADKLRKTIKPEYDNVSSEDKPWLSLVPIDVIKEIDVAELEEIFIHTTVEAILQHCKLLNKIKKIEEITHTYKSWRTTKI